MSDPAPAAKPAPAWVDAPVQFTGFADRYARTKLDYLMSPRKLARLILETRAPAKEQLPWVKLAVFGAQPSDGGCLRHDENVAECCGCECDYDGALHPETGRPTDFLQARDVLKRRNIRAILATSPSHFITNKGNPRGHPRWRVWAPFSEPMEPCERAVMVSRLAGVFAEIGCAFAGESWTLSQAYYIGAVLGSPHHKVLLIGGDPINLQHDLDEIAVGKPTAAGQARGTDEAPGDGQDALLAAIVTGASFHPATVSLAGVWAAQGKPLNDALALIRAAFLVVPEDRRDARWQARIDDVARCVGDIYRKHRRTDAPIPPLRMPAGLLDPHGYALTAIRKMRERVLGTAPEERATVLRIEARNLARFVNAEWLLASELREGLRRTAVAAGIDRATAQEIVSAVIEGETPG